MNRTPPRHLLLVALAVLPWIAAAQGRPPSAAPAQPASPTAAGARAAAPTTAAAAAPAAKTSAPTTAAVAPPPVAPRAGPAIPPVPSAPTAEFDKLKFLVGAFACDVENPQRPGSAALPVRTKGRFVGKLDLGGFFVTYQYAEPRTKERPNPFASSGFLGWDPALGRYVFAQADNRGLSFLLRADVPPVDQYVFKGTATASWGRHLPAAWTVTRTVKGFDVVAEGTDVDGEMSRLANLSCVKGGK